ncbi:MAG: carboxypeptidase-like regulatory domain-containing protein [Candidatus Sericytochromatia bacterium]
MLAKKLLVASIITSLLAGCGGNAVQPALPEGDYGSDVMAPADDFGTDTGSYDPTTDSGYGDDVATEPDQPTDTESPDATEGYTLKGLIADAAGKAIAGATVTIGAQTVVTDSAGKYEITQIARDSKVFVSVTKTGYDSLTNKEVAFTDAAPVVTQDFKLALKTGTETNTDTVVAGLSHKMTFASKNFKAVHSMVVAAGNVYVLGTIDGLLLDSTAIVTFNAEDGEALNTFKKISFFSSLPKSVTRLKVDGDEVVASNGEENFSFSLTGSFVKKASGSLPALVTEVTDSERSISYKLKSSSEVTVTKGGTAKHHKLTNVGYAKAIGLDGDGKLVVLDSSNKVVHQFAYED